MSSSALSNFSFETSLKIPGRRYLGWLRSRFLQASSDRAETTSVNTSQLLNAAEADYQHKTTLVMAACHDMRQPLQALGILSEYLTDVNLEPQHQKIALQMHQAVGTLYGMLDQMLMMLQLDTPAYQTAVSDFSIGEILCYLKNDLEPLAKAKDIELAVECSSTFIRSDRVLLYRVLSNLICNAISYTEAGGVTVRCLDNQATLRIEVSDTGVGIAENSLPHIFEDFFRVDRSKSANHLGLGLANVRRIVNMMDWRLDVRSECGKGSTFGIEIDWPMR